MTLDDIGLYSQPAKAPLPHQPLHLQTRCVCALIRRFLPKLRNEHAWKINVYVQDVNDRQQVSTHNGITSIKLRRDVQRFFTLSDAEKKLFAYEALRAGTTIVSDHHGWPTPRVLEAFDAALDRNLVNEWAFQPKWNPSRDLRAYVLCSHETDRFRAWLRVKDRAGQLVAEKFLFDDTPDEFCFLPRLGKVRWTAKTTVRLVDKSGRAVGDDLKVDLDSKAVG